ncbi:MAG: hypothetical protein C3F13_13360 [Anaerolineales bacterium]|nr:hypothetical protein [Anaerolineae bacterium]PWB51425.1 MAG: hypothetical protein C3F13_13360 [Anaerolineales bacterium]
MQNWFIWLFIIFALIGPLIYSATTLRNFFISLRIPTTWISALPGKGWVEVTGRIHGEPIKSLLRKADCAYWQLEVQEYQSGNRGGGRWRSIYKKSSGSFLVDDMTGRIKIQEGKPALVMNNEYLLDKLDESTRELLESIGVKTKGFLNFDKRLRVFERLIAPDEEILVLGRLQKSEVPVSISGNEIVPQVISNMNRAEMNKALFNQAVRPMLLPYLVVMAFIIFFLYEFLK